MSPCRPRPFAAPLAAFLIALFGLVQPLAAATAPARGRGTVTNQEAAVILRATYTRLAGYTAASGSALSLELSGFRTVGPERFGELVWLDLATMPGGRMIDVTRGVESNEYVGLAGVSYRPSWSQGDAAWAHSDEGSKMVGLTADRALAAASRQTSELAGVVAITAFRVTVSLAGESRSYNAAALWLPNPSATERRFFPVDHIVQGVEEAAREELPALGTAGLLELGLADADHNLVGTPQGLTCSSWSSTTTKGYVATGTGGHAWGEHKGTSSFKIVCGCTSSCASTCTASIPSAGCNDSGFSEMCHKMASSLNANATRNDNGKTTAAACAAGYGCVKKSCLFCLCGLGVSVGVSGATVSFTPSGSPDWTGNTQYSRTCAKCT